MIRGSREDWPGPKGSAFVGARSKPSHESSLPLVDNHGICNPWNELPITVYEQRYKLLALTITKNQRQPDIRSPL